MKKTLGIAIPTYKPHIPLLYKLLDTISNSTVLPDQVSVSVSSIEKKEELEFNSYPFELIVTSTHECKNASQNRNIASSKLTTDVVSFIDGDDVPHIKRNEYIMKSVQEGCEVIVHNYQLARTRDDDYVFSDIGEYELKRDYIDMFDPNILPYPTSSQERFVVFHNAHVTITRELANIFKYDEYWREIGEDAIFNRQLLCAGNKLSYISNKLSMYVNPNFAKEYYTN